MPAVRRFQPFNYPGYDPGDYSGYDNPVNDIDYSDPPRVDNGGPGGGVKDEVTSAAPAFKPSFTGFEQSKLSDPGKAGSSPKYQFGQLAQSGKYGYNQSGDMLAELQKLYPDFWQGWEADKDIFRYKGDKSKLNPAWDGLTEFDVVTNFGDENQQFAWQPTVAGGAREPGGAPPGLFSPLSSQGYATSGGSGGGSSRSGPAGFAGLKDAIAGLFPGGMFNQDIVNRRVSSATDALERQKKSRLASNQAILADRGLIGSGPEITAMNRLTESLGNQFAGAASDIYADESEAADRRMMTALQIAAGMTEAEAEQAIAWFRAQSDDRLGSRKLDIENTLGLGNLALGNMNSVNNYNLGLGRLGLDRDRLGYDLQNADTDRLIAIIDAYLKGADISSGGYIGRR